MVLDQNYEGAEEKIQIAAVTSSQPLQPLKPLIWNMRCHGATGLF